MKKRILLVDDEVDLLEVIDEFLTEEGYAVTCAQNGREALDLLAKEYFDLLLSDINMPGMKGFELLHTASQRFPKLKTALITAYDVRDYILLARDHNVSNIIAKTTPFNFNELAVMVHNILYEEVFGLERYIDGPVHSTSVTHTNQIEKVIHEIISSMPDPRHQRKFRQTLGEMIINAVFYGARNERGDRKAEWQIDVTLAPEEEVAIFWGQDKEKVAAAVRDQKGRLTKRDVLYWLERNTTKGSDGLSRGLFDEHGKGIFISRETVDRFIVNIKRNVMTEVIMIDYHEGLYDGFRPLWIHEF